MDPISVDSLRRSDNNVWWGLCAPWGVLGDARAGTQPSGHRGAMSPCRCTSTAAAASQARLGNGWQSRSMTDEQVLRIWTGALECSENPFVTGTQVVDGADGASPPATRRRPPATRRRPRATEGANRPPVSKRQAPGPVDPSVVLNEHNTRAAVGAVRDVVAAR